MGILRSICKAIVRPEIRFVMDMEDAAAGKQKITVGDLRAMAKKLATTELPKNLIIKSYRYKPQELAHAFAKVSHVENRFMPLATAGGLAAGMGLMETALDGVAAGGPVLALGGLAVAGIGGYLYNKFSSAAIAPVEATLNNHRRHDPPTPQFS